MGFLGPIGLDAFVYRDAAGAARLKPIVEINPRYTMGRVLVELMRQTSLDGAGVFQLVALAQVKADGFPDFPSFARWLAEKHPLELEAGPLPRLRAGALCLNDPAAAKVCLAIFRAGRSLEPLLAAAKMNSPA